MSTLPHFRGLARWAPLPRRTVRLRLTALYGALFLATGIGLLTITNILARSWPWPRPVIGSGSGRVCEVTHPVCFSPAELLAQAAAGHAADLNQLLADSAIALGVMTMVSAALGWLVAGRVLRPLRAMAAAARAISADDLSRRLAVPGPGDELKDLGDTIDELLRRLETAFGVQRRFAASASHELRTPLAMMRTSLDVATAKPGPVPAELTVLAGKLREGLDQADQLVENLLLLARAQHGARDDQETIPQGPLLTSAIDDQAGLIASMGLVVRQASGAGPLVTGNPVLLARMTANLIDNAVRHNHPGGWIGTQITLDGPVVRLLVENGGPLRDPGEVTTLTQPFRRLGTDRTGSSTGTGLGLSIAEAIATAHGGTLHLHARPEGGLRAVIDLPAASGTNSPAQLAMAGGARRGSWSPRMSGGWPMTSPKASVTRAWPSMSPTTARTPASSWPWIPTTCSSWTGTCPASTATRSAA
jgi:signal transduction histidine kinase